MVKIERHCNDPNARWRALADTSFPEDGSGVYGGYGDTPLDAVTDLANDLANVVAYAAWGAPYGAHQAD